MPAGQLGFDRQQLGGGPSETVRLGDYQGVAVPQVSQALCQLGTLGDARHLFGEDLLRPRGQQVTLLRFEAGGLLVGGGAGLSEEHGFAPIGSIHCGHIVPKMQALFIWHNLEAARQ
jgi:hypothetical protein